MKKIILLLLVLLPELFLTGCIIGTNSTPEYVSPGYNASHISSTGYGISDYGLGFGTNYNPRYGLMDFGIEH
ncbi:hypothetical protein [Legionella saoudiensis]|uniref:hypothetical protein n=1 Tax=Legionella saoudiensis TaxID=1750561 RepID=UPI00072FB137|nr:hypothetical protein [Legionella saoudiensis]